ncbi:MAG TPA: Uma2 family endonuclease [Polyangiaceae bacterium]|nr:Uma2 family endonuclease [Polyangiaceae bacterium]
MPVDTAHRPLHHYDYATYLAHESFSNVKHEYLDGEIYAMAGGTLEHAALAVNVSTALNLALRGRPCIVASSDLKVRIQATTLCTYPDVTVICGSPERDSDATGEVVLNPTLLVEVTSKSSEEWDRGEKREHYQQIPSLREYIVVSHRAQRLERFYRDADGAWQHAVAGPGEQLSLDTLDCSLATDDVYRNVDVS